MGAGGKRAWRVLIVDDHPVVREGIRMCLKDQREVMLVGEAKNGSEAAKLVRETRPDIVLLDLVMPRMSGLEALPGIRRACPKTRALICTYHNTSEHVQEAVAAGVEGYLLKDSSPAEYIEAIRTVMGGKFFVSDAAAQYLKQPEDGPNALGFGLTPREFEFMALAARGDRPPQIARAMGCSEVTVRTYRKRVMKKLKLPNLAGLVRFALEHGM